MNILNEAIKMSVLPLHEQSCTKWNETLGIHTEVPYEILPFSVSRQICFPQNHCALVLHEPFYNFSPSHFFLLVFTDNATFPSLPLSCSYFHVQFLTLTNSELILKNCFHFPYSSSALDI